MFFFRWNTLEIQKEIWGGGLQHNHNPSSSGVTGLADVWNRRWGGRGSRGKGSRGCKVCEVELLS